MSHDPYSPPESELTTDGAGSAYVGGTGLFDIERALSEGWGATWANFPLWLGVGIVAFVLSLLSVITIIGAIFALPVLLYGWIFFSLNMSRGTAQFSDLFAGFSRYGRALIQMLGFSLLMGLVGAGINSITYLGQIMGNTTIEALGWLVYLVLYLTVFPRLLLAQFYLVDRDAGPIEALKRSWQATAPQKLRAVGLFLCLIVVSLIGVLVLLIGIVPAQVIGYLVWVSAYRQIEGDPAPAS